MIAAMTFVAEGAGHPENLPFDSWIFGAIAFVAFLLLLGITYTFRKTAEKYGQTSTYNAPDDAATAPHEPGRVL